MSASFSDITDYVQRNKDNDGPIDTRSLSEPQRRILYGALACNMGEAEANGIATTWQDVPFHQTVLTLEKIKDHLENGWEKLELDNGHKVYILYEHPELPLFYATTFVDLVCHMRKASSEPCALNSKDEVEYGIGLSAKRTAISQGKLEEKLVPGIGVDEVGLQAIEAEIGISIRREGRAIS